MKGVLFKIKLKENSNKITSKSLVFKNIKNIMKKISNSKK